MHCNVADNLNCLSGWPDESLYSLITFMSSRRWEVPASMLRVGKFKFVTVNHVSLITHQTAQHCHKLHAVSFYCRLSQSSVDSQKSAVVACAAWIQHSVAYIQHCVQQRSEGSMWCRCPPCTTFCALFTACTCTEWCTATSSPSSLDGSMRHSSGSCWVCPLGPTPALLAAAT